jgi:hypothetical protein
MIIERSFIAYLLIEELSFVGQMAFEWGPGVHSRKIGLREEESWIL